MCGGQGTALRDSAYIETIQQVVTPYETYTGWASRDEMAITLYL